MAAQNDVATATEWMSTTVRGLGLKRPLEMMRTRMETKAIFGHIGRLERGILF
ncbi:antitoxin Xre/MbcA/ParS toxin-binding domain-containing protein [Pseudomonas silesiensis]|uniref:antitoxin Xre/MbcA/ParS toxin-binding domain-containing protein n=1 Tax=Pseudomonas silesiensis TaxID=1853130 RepID=UPI0034D652A5